MATQSIVRHRTGVVLVALGAVLFSCFGLAIRHIEVASPWAVLFWRSVAMTPAIVAYLAVRSNREKSPKILHANASALVGGLALVLAFCGGVYSIATTNIANAVFLLTATPFLVAILSWLLLREPVRPTTWVAIALAGLGMFITVREGLAMGAMAGNVAALLASLGFAAFTITLRWGHQSNMMPSVLYGGILTACTAATVTYFEGGTLLVPLNDVLIAMFMGAGLLTVGMILYTVGGQAVPAAELALLGMIEALLSPVWVWLFLGETATMGTIVGGAIILIAIGGDICFGLRRNGKWTPA